MMFIPKTVFVDTNVLLDYLLKRPGEEPAGKLLSLGRERLLRICISSLSVANVAYIMRKEMSKDRLISIFKDWLNDFVIQELGDVDVLHAAKSDCPDFEDALQISCAQTPSCIAIVTNNKKHFEPYTDMPVLTPDELLDKLTRAS